MNTVPTPVSGPSTGSYWVTADVMNAVPTPVAWGILLVFERYWGAPANPDESNVVDRKNQNLNVIDALPDKIVGIIPLGVDGQWGDDVGYVKFDPGLHRIFVVVQQLADPDSPK
jgi:hypothetical protein